MNLRAADFYMTRFAHGMRGAMKLLGDLESDLLGERLERIAIDRPVFIAGLARSGTTILLSLFATHPQVATHLYRDFPFLFVPYVWNRLQTRMAKAEPPIERAHRDRILITRESPEAFEEPIWSHFFPRVHDMHACHVLAADEENPEFDVFYRQHMRKILLLRGGKRYVSKGNYNVTRIGYLARLFPDARFVVPVRHPVSQVESLVRQHRLFTAYSAQDPRIPDYMRAAGHYEFGPQRAPISVDAIESGRTQEAWVRGEDHSGYALMWRSVYSHVVALATQDVELAPRISIVRYEDLCEKPAENLRELFEFCELTEGAERVLSNLPGISTRKRPPQLSDTEREAVWSETATLAESLGYDANGAVP